MQGRILQSCLFVCRIAKETEKYLVVEERSRGEIVIWEEKANRGKEGMQKAKVSGHDRAKKSVRHKYACRRDSRMSRQNIAEDLKSRSTANSFNAHPAPQAQ